MIYDWQPLWLTFKLASVTTLILILIGVPLAYWLAYTRRRWKYLVETVVSLPLVLPPSVLGFYLLVAFAPNSSVGRLLESTFDLRLVFTFAGLVVGSVIFSLPFLVQPVQAGFQHLPVSLREAAYTLGKSRWQTFIHVLVPGARPSLLAGAILAFAHTVGEFGVVLMIGGNLPGETRVASIAIYDEVESLNYDTANFYSLVLIAVSFAILLSLHFINRRQALRA